MTRLGDRRARAILLPVFIAVCLAIGWLGGVATGSSRADWYADLLKPPLNPPDRVFAPVWAILYIFMAVAGWRLLILRNPCSNNSLRALFAAQLVLNGVWSFLFFGARSPLAGLVDILALWACLLMLIRTAWVKDRVSGYLLAPYFLWVSFAAYLNAGIWWLNLSR
ncbi:MAG: Tryptophan-rich protein TspO [Candidatus Omnitrophica bacterium]|nr:Tryptophan-rich protein TspO [Candidatus Omnitrophota bacterium]